MALTSLFDLCPLLVLSAEKSFVRQRVDLWTVKHLPMDQTETFEGHYNHVCVLLADSDHKSACKAQIGDQHVYDVAESEL